MSGTGNPAVHPKGRSALAPGRPLCAFDLLELGGKDLRRKAPEERKRALAKLLRKAGSALHFNDHIDEAGDIVFRHACKLGFEGIVSRRLGSRYVSGRSRHWIKSKNPAGSGGDP